MAGGGGGGSEFDVSLNLVALIDILTNLLFFLLIGFVEQEMEFDAGAKIKLPASGTQQKLELSVSVTITPDDLQVEKVPICNVKNGKIDAPMEGDKIVPLYDKLNQLRAARQAQSAGLSKNDDVIFLLADRGATFTLLAPVMKTAAMAGYPNFRFAVVKN